MDAVQRHADLALGDAERDVDTPSDLAAIRERHASFVAMKEKGPLSFWTSIDRAKNPDADE